MSLYKKLTECIHQKDLKAHLHDDKNVTFCIRLGHLIIKNVILFMQLAILRYVKTFSLSCKRVLIEL